MSNILKITATIALACLTLGVIGLIVYVNILYWNTPISEIPLWVTWLLF